MLTAIFPYNRQAEGRRMIRDCRTADDFALLIERSKEKPQVLLKHSSKCHISKAALAEFKLLEDKVDGAELWQVRVVENGEISAIIADTTGTEHRSPQVILFRYGKPVWNASHFDINCDSILNAIEEI
jgi:bacillithiol system protein YtxJ